MKRLQPDYRLAGYSYAEVIRRFQSACVEFGELDFIDRKVSGGHVLNCIVLEWLSMNHEERAQWVRSGLRRLEEVATRAEEHDPGGREEGSNPATIRRPKREGAPKAARNPKRDGSSSKAVRRKH